MTRRGGTLQLRCSVDGCTERPHLVAYDTLREAKEIREYYAKRPYKCSRHTRPDEVLSAGSPATVCVMVARKRPGCGDKLFWVDEADERGANGVSFGPGFKAWANDFAEGTRLVVSAMIGLPDSDTQGGGE
jgi:hypothetical protein